MVNQIILVTRYMLHRRIGGYYIPKNSIPNIFSAFRIECEEAQEDKEEDEDPNDLPVQGPLPQEPEDAPWKRNDSGVRRL